MSEAISPQEAQLLFAPVEAILMVVDQPVTSEELGRVLNLSPRGYGECSPHACCRILGCAGWP